MLAAREDYDSAASCGNQGTNVMRRSGLRFGVWMEVINGLLYTQLSAGCAELPSEQNWQANSRPRTAILDNSSRFPRESRT